MLYNRVKYYFIKIFADYLSFCAIPFSLWILIFV